MFGLATTKKNEDNKKQVEHKRRTKVTFLKTTNSGDT